MTALEQLREVAALVTGGGLPAGAGAPPADALAAALYEHWYLQMSALPAPPGPLRPIELDVVAALRAAHAGSDRYEPGWRARRVSTHGRAEVARGDRTRVVDRGDYVVPDRPGLRAEPGDELTVAALRGHAGRRLLGDVPGRLGARRHRGGDAGCTGGCRRTRHPRSCARSPTLLLDEGAACALKAPTHAAGFARADAVVTYLRPPTFSALSAQLAGDRGRAGRRAARPAAAADAAARARRRRRRGPGGRRELRAVALPAGRGRAGGAGRPARGRRGGAHPRELRRRRARSRPPAPRAWGRGALCLVTRSGCSTRRARSATGSCATRCWWERALHVARRRRRAGRGRLAVVHRSCAGELYAGTSGVGCSSPAGRAHRRRAARAAAAGALRHALARRGRRPLALRRGDGDRLGGGRGGSRDRRGRAGRARGGADGADRRRGAGGGRGRRPRGRPRRRGARPARPRTGRLGVPAARAAAMDLGEQLVAVAHRDASGLSWPLGGARPRGARPVRARARGVGHRHALLELHAAGGDAALGAAAAAAARLRARVAEPGAGELARPARPGSRGRRGRHAARLLELLVPRRGRASGSRGCARGS